MPAPLVRAIIYVPAGDELDDRLPTCRQYCEDCGYDIVGVATGPTGWTDAESMLDGHAADVIVAWRYPDIPAEHLYPLVELVDPTCR